MISIVRVKNSLNCKYRRRTNKARCDISREFISFSVRSKDLPGWNTRGSDHGSGSWLKFHFQRKKTQPSRKSQFPHSLLGVFLKLKASIPFLTSRDKVRRKNHKPFSLFLPPGENIYSFVRHNESRILHTKVSAWNFWKRTASSNKIYRHTWNLSKLQYFTQLKICAGGGESSKNSFSSVRNISTQN